jgi:two-component system LytT family response regulator
MYTCIIVDDQLDAAELLKGHVLKVPKLSLQLITTDSIAALTFLDNNKPDIIFLDIEMPGLSGIEFTGNIKAKWGNNAPKIVFTTGHPDYALTGYEHGVSDYLVKPIYFSRFKKCTDRIIDELDKLNTAPGNPGYFFVEEVGKKTKINMDEIIYIKAAGNYVTIVTTGNKITTYDTMSRIQELLPCDKFIRVHKSYIIAVRKIRSVNSNEIVMNTNHGEERIPIGVKFKNDILKQLGIS